MPQMWAFALREALPWEPARKDKLSVRQQRSRRCDFAGDKWPCRIRRAACRDPRPRRNPPPPARQRIQWFHRPNFPLPVPPPAPPMRIRLPAGRDPRPRRNPPSPARQRIQWFRRPNFPLPALPPAQPIRIRRLAGRDPRLPRLLPVLPATRILSPEIRVSLRPWEQLLPRPAWAVDFRQGDDQRTEPIPFPARPELWHPRRNCCDRSGSHSRKSPRPLTTSTVHWSLFASPFLLVVLVNG